MTPQEALRDWQRKQKMVTDYVANKMPRIIAVIAKNWFSDAYLRGGWYDDNGGFHKWQRTFRQNFAGTKNQYEPLTSSRNHLKSSLQTRTIPGGAVIFTTVPYASIHNDGGTIDVTVTKKMKQYMWYMFYKTAKIRRGQKRKKDASVSGEAEFYRNFALTKKQSLQIKIPQRKFLYQNKVLFDTIKSRVMNDLRNILTS